MQSLCTQSLCTQSVCTQSVCTQSVCTQTSRKGMPMDDKDKMLRHLLAALAYRVQKAVGDAPHGYAGFRAAPGVRTPHQIVRHITSVLGYARTFFVGGTWRPPMLEDFDEEVLRFHDLLKDLSHHLAAGTPLVATTPERLLQGPFSDAMTHAGQLALLRRLFGAPIPPENFIVADIDAANLGPDQPPPVSPDEDWIDAEGERQRLPPAKDRDSGARPTRASSHRTGGT
jgi:hypothetical protein